MDLETTITPRRLARIRGRSADRDRARRGAALRAEADAFVARHAEETLPDGRQRVVRHGYGPERSIQTGIGTLEVRRPKVRDRAEGVPAEKRIRVSSGILPRWARRSKSLDAPLPVLSLRGISTEDFQGEAPTATRPITGTTCAPFAGRPHPDRERSGRGSNPV